MRTMVHAVRGRTGSRAMGRPKLVGIGLALLVCVGVVASSSAEEPIRIGGSISLTGAYAAIGQNVHRGQLLCVKHTNAKGGVLGRAIALTVEDDRSQPATAVGIYEKLFAQDKVELVLSPYSSPITDAVADVTERLRMPLVACCAATSSVYKKKGRRLTFMFTSPAGVYLEGLIELAARRGLRTLALLHEDTLLPAAIVQGTQALARRKGLQVVLIEAYPRGRADYSAILSRVRALNPDVLAAATYFEDAVTLARELKAREVSLKMVGMTTGVDLPKFHESLGATAEFIYGPTKWEPELVTLRAGGLVPVARLYPGAREFVELHHRDFPGAGLSYQTAEGYGACQVLVEAVKRAGSLNAERLREVILEMDFNTVFGRFRVDPDGLQVGHRMLLFQWQGSRKVIVWPDELATGPPRFPTPPWSQR